MPLPAVPPAVFLPLHLCGVYHFARVFPASNIAIPFFSNMSLIFIYFAMPKITEKDSHGVYRWASRSSWGCSPR